jgi:hypothetical protein
MSEQYREWLIDFGASGYVARHRVLLTCCLATMLHLPGKSVCKCHTLPLVTASGFLQSPDTVASTVKTLQ